MSGSGVSIRLAAFGAAACLLAGVLAGVGLRPVFGGAAGDADKAGAPAAARPQTGAAGPARGGPPFGGRGAMLPAITTALVQTSSVEKRVDAVGESRSARSVTLIAEATGLVREVRIKPGAKVAAGDLLLQIDDSEQQIALARLKTQYPIARTNADRYAELLKEDAASRLEAEAAFNAFKAVEADLKAAEFAVSQRTVRAPFAGVVGLTSIEPGDYIRAGDVAATIDDLSALIIEFTAPQESAGDVRVGQSVRASLASSQGESVTGEISAVDTRIDPASRTLKVEATFANADGALIPGATYAVTTINAGAPALAMPGLAVQWDRTGAYVWKLGGDGAIARTAIRILQRRDQLVIAEGDLAPGDRIIVEGADRVRPGMRFPDAAERPERDEKPAAG